ncbi:MAG: hypothetical protein AB7V43_23590, partial [Acidimicrobiia bacterium]
ATPLAAGSTKYCHPKRIARTLLTGGTVLAGGVRRVGGVEMADAGFPELDLVPVVVCVEESVEADSVVAIDGVDSSLVDAPSPVVEVSGVNGVLSLQEARRLARHAIRATMMTVRRGMWAVWHMARRSSPGGGLRAVSLVGQVGQG